VLSRRAVKATRLPRNSSRRFRAGKLAEAHVLSIQLAAPRAAFSFPWYDAGLSFFSNDDNLHLMNYISIRV